MKLGKPLHHRAQLEIVFEGINAYSKPQVDLINSVYVETVSNIKNVVVEWVLTITYDLESNPNVEYWFESNAEVVSVTSLQIDLLVLSNFVKDGYNAAAKDFSMDLGNFPLSDSNQFDEIASRLLEAVVISGLYDEHPM